MSKLKYDEELLDSMINYVQLEEYTEKLKFKKNKFIIKIIKCTILLAMPIIICTFIKINSPYFLLELIGNTCFATASLTYIAKIIIDDITDQLCLDELDSNIKHIDDKRGYITLKKEEILTRIPEEFYTNDYYIYKNSIDKKFELVKDKKELQLSKNDSIDQINENIKNYYYNYNLPHMTVKDDELNNFLKSVYEVFESISQEEKFYEYMSSVCGYAISKNLVNDRKTIEMSDFINALNYLKLCGINQKNIDQIKEKVSINQTDKVIDFVKYKKIYNKKSS